MVSRENMMSLGIGASFGVICFVGAEAVHGFSPAHAREAQVFACAPQLPATATISDVPPSHCDPFIGDWSEGLYRLRIPSSTEFVEVEMPKSDYTAQQTYDYAKVSLLMGAIIGGGFKSLVYAWSMDPSPNKQQPTPRESTRFAGNVNISLKKRRKTSAQASSYPEHPDALDSKVNQAILDMRYRQLRASGSNES